MGYRQAHQKLWPSLPATRASAKNPTKIIHDFGSSWNHSTIFLLYLLLMAPTAVPPLQYETTIPPKITRIVGGTDKPSVDSSPDVITPLRNALASESTPLAVRFRALFSLKHHASLRPPDSTTIPAIQAIAAAFSSPSALLKHELAYCLGQSGNHAAVPFLRDVLSNKQEDSMCRHEAAEALGALDDITSLDFLQKFWQDEKEPAVVRETCEIAIRRIEWSHSEHRKTERLKDSDFASVDPAPPVPQETQPSVAELQAKLLDTRLSLFDRYRAMFAIRDQASPPDLPTAIPAVHALASGFTDPSALFRHEVAFVFGQLSHPASIPCLVKVLGNLKEESMVRHEAAEALGSLGEEEGVEEMLRKFLNDEAQVVRESVVVALDMAEYERSGQSEYATLPE